MTDANAAYDLALDYLYSYVDYSLKHSSELAKAEFNLERMRKLMAALGNPQDKYPILHVAGTKGKGSVCALAANGLKAAGHRVGLYTSPHLLDYCERIQVNGEPVSHPALISLVERTKDAVAQVAKITTFEITTALALLHFAETRVDAAVVEVGLGGRLDATNIVAPLVTTITSLSYDHMAVLGDTLAKIAGEKAGIIKEGVPVISAPQKDEALRVLEGVAGERHASFKLVGREISFTAGHHSLEGQSLQVANQSRMLSLTIPLLGLHQVQNAATAAASLWEMSARGLRIPDEAIQKGFAEVLWPARFEIARIDPPVIFDSAHNEDLFARLRETLDDYFPGKPVYLVFGASEDKNIPGMFAEMRGKVRRAADHESRPSAGAAHRTDRSARGQAGLEAEVLPHVAAAFERALELSQKDGSITLSAGSMFVTAEAIAAWRARRASRAHNEP